MKALKVGIVVSALAATTLALAQSVTPQKPAQPPQPAGNASGGQTQGAAASTAGGFSIGGLGTVASLAIVAGAVVVVAAAANSSNTTTNH